jgi:hypothetical protein
MLRHVLRDFTSFRPLLAQAYNVIDIQNLVGNIGLLVEKDAFGRMEYGKSSEWESTATTTSLPSCCRLLLDARVAGVLL